MISPEVDPQEQVSSEILNLMLDIHIIMKIAVPNLTGIQEAKIHLLYILEESSPQSMTELCNQMYISKPYMTRLVDNLVSEGAIERHPDEKDRRVINISITDEGKESLRKMFMDLKGYLKPYLSEFSSADLHQICMASKDLHTTFMKNPTFRSQGISSVYHSPDHQKKE
jgi:DNA-binding MarR family transcriptional regulator